MRGKAAVIFVAWVGLLSSCGKDAESEDCGQEVKARAYDKDRNCFAVEAQVVGCIATGLSCPPAITYGVDQQGRCFAFPSCLPAGFTRAGPGAACSSQNVLMCEASK
jgi:hypothetical protein